MVLFWRFCCKKYNGAIGIYFGWFKIYRFFLAWLPLHMDDVINFTSTCISGSVMEIGLYFFPSILFKWLINGPSPTQDSIIIGRKNNYSRFRWWLPHLSPKAMNNRARPPPALALGTRAPVRTCSSPAGGPGANWARRGGGPTVERAGQARTAAGQLQQESIVSLSSIFLYSFHICLFPDIIL